MREGLWAEQHSPPDYKAALLSYLAALEQADIVNLPPLSDEYTGLQLKIAEMYEKLGMIEEARLMYRELGTAYIQALTEGNGTEKKKMPDRLRSHMIQRDLRVALKTAYLESHSNPNMAKMGLMVHFMMAQEEVARRNPEMAKLIRGSTDINKSSDGQGFTLSFDIEPKANVIDAWSPFREELFSARDMYVALCVATGDIGHAIQTKLVSTEWMAVCGFDAGETLMSFYNVGSMLYLQAEDFEVMDHKGTTMTPGSTSTTTQEMAETSLKTAQSCFTMILELIAGLPSKRRREGDVDQVQALATYGLGVIALHKGDLEKASELLRESRLRAKGCEYEDLVVNSEMELEKVDSLVKEREVVAKGLSL